MSETLTPDQIRSCTIASLARAIRQDWKKPYFGVKPYLEAMDQMHFVDPKGETYVNEPAVDVLNYALSNMTTWRGEVAKVIKAELKRRVK